MLGRRFGGAMRSAPPPQPVVAVFGILALMTIKCLA
jgi:hypothetical protein